MATTQELINVKYDKLVAERKAYLKTLISEEILAHYAAQNKFTFEEMIADVVGITLSDKIYSKDIKGVEYFINSTGLYLASANLTSIGNLSSLTKMVILSITANQFTNIGTLSFMTNLTTLNAGSNKLTFIGSLSACNKLVTCYLNSNLFTSFPATYINWTKLVTFSLEANQINTAGVDAILASAKTAVDAQVAGTGRVLATLKLSGSLMGIPTGGASNANYAALIAAGVAVTIRTV